MPRFAAHLDRLFTEVAFADRFSVAADAGFVGVELAAPYDHDAGWLAEKLARHGLILALFDLPPVALVTGIAAQRLAYRAAGGRALMLAAATGARRLHVPRTTGDARGPGWRDRLADLCDAAGPRGVEIVISPDDPPTRDLIAALDRPNLRLLFALTPHDPGQDDRLTRSVPLIGHVRLADVPDTPDDVRVLRRLDTLGYGGCVGIGYRPAALTLAGLGWMAAFRG